MVTLKDTTALLKRVHTLLKHQEQTEALRGESFNVFSVLQMERSENATHSALLAELLNPKGSHKKGSRFLQRFLECLPASVQFDTATTRVVTEHSIGMRNNDELTGGRLDIFLRDEKGRCLTIENKIYAGDQEGQIQRYCNFNPGANAVFYLTLQGTEPSAKSKGSLQSGKHFHLISYREHIAGWLQACHAEAADVPMLRETIKQYLLLIKKLTGTMTDAQHETELANLLMEHYEEAEYIVSNFHLVRQQLQQEVRAAVLQKLQVGLKDENGLTATQGSAIQHSYAQIWIWYSAYEKATLCFGIESFNGTGHSDGNLFVGVFNHGGKSNSYITEHELESKQWPDVKFLEWRGHRINLGNAELLKQLQREPKGRQELAELIANEAMLFINQRKADVWAYTKAEIVTVQKDIQ